MVKSGRQVNAEAYGDLLVAWEELVDAAALLMAQYEIEEEEHGFPFNFALRRAHRNLKNVLRHHVGGHRERWTGP